MIGMVITLKRLITAVSEIDSATSPRAKAVRMLDVTPPGAAAMIIRPSASSGAIGQMLARANATAGSTTIWDTAPTAKSRGTARHPREIVEGEPEPERKHDECEREREHDIDDESHGNSLDRSIFAKYGARLYSMTTRRERSQDTRRGRKRMIQVAQSGSTRAGADVVAPLTFIVPQETKPVFHSTALTGGTQKLFFETESRSPYASPTCGPLTDDLSIDREGFELLRHRNGSCPTSMTTTRSRTSTTPKSRRF